MTTVFNPIEFFTGFFVGVLFTVVSCMVAVKLTNIMTHQTDNDIVWGGFLFVQSLLLNLTIFLFYQGLTRFNLTVYGRTFSLFENLSSGTYYGVVIIVSLLFLPIACTLLTKARTY